ncbi:hypothetical protein CLV46_2619 [Diaminobutyricimonas aerilata]|uniref:Uncharacterized protein n=1 Tax=Diaminobutyricimonas aerilata TaxID=1162967 RepID=A0A2M9CMD6_9MICO|nr:hypothetical protein [Diaminobutyricimonas aerilata]PJJ73038.1 hypothetical protein CLV46_2619 [Diaminobutyricimonas aerilata]
MIYSFRHMDRHRGLRPDHIAVHPMVAGGWRIVDMRMISAGMECVLGFVARRGDVFEVVRIDTPHSRTYCADLDEAVGVVLRPHVFYPWLPHFGARLPAPRVALAA